MKKIQSHVLKKRNSFNNTEQQLFLGSFYCYLNYDTTNDYVIDLNHIWKWLGFSRIDPCKRVLEKNFAKDIDYKIILSNLNEKLAPQVGGADTLNNKLIFHQVVEKKIKRHEQVCINGVNYIFEYKIIY